MKFKTFKFMYLLSYQASIWLILAIGYFDINRFFSIFSAFLAIVGAICTAVLYQKINKVEKLMFAKGFTSKLEESNSIFVASKILKEGGSSYFFGAVIWVAVGGFLFYIFYKIGQTSYYPVVGIIIKVLHVVVLLLFIVVLCHLINNPIVRALIIMFGFGSLLDTILSNSQIAIIN